MRADVTDPVGATLSDPRLPVAPDLVRAIATIENGSLTLVVSFAPGTFDRQTTRVAVLLDTDQNPATGIRQPSVPTSASICSRRAARRRLQALRVE